MRVAEAIELNAKTTSELLTLSRGRRVEARVQQRASVVLLAAQGWQNKDIADEVKLDRRQVALWRRRFIEGGLPALLQDASRAGRTPGAKSEIESRILSTTLHEQPASAAHWSTRTLASHLGLSATTIRRVWLRNGIQPHLKDAIKVASEPPLRIDAERAEFVGLYMNPRERVLVLSCAGQGPLQTLNRTEARRTGKPNDEHRHHGTTTLLAALKKLEGTVTSVCKDRHRHEEWLMFLRLVDRKTPKHLQLHLIVENQATHKRPKVQDWLARHPRMVVHSTPIDTSWLSMVRRFFREIAERGIQHVSFSSATELRQAMAQYSAHLDKEPRPFTWTIGAPDTAQAVRARAALARWKISAEQNGAPQHEAGVTTAQA